MANFCAVVTRVIKKPLLFELNSRIEEGCGVRVPTPILSCADNVKLTANKIAALKMFFMFG
jgi:hypothetical protein